MWLNLYDFDTESYQLIEDIRDSYFLVAIIDNDYVSANGGSALWDAMLQVAKNICISPEAEDRIVHFELSES
jgi:methylenetetrahydrofolate reductase (NADPH)